MKPLFLLIPSPSLCPSGLGNPASALVSTYGGSFSSVVNELSACASSSRVYGAGPEPERARKRSTCEREVKAPVPTQAKHVCSGWSVQTRALVSACRAEEGRRERERRRTVEAPLEPVQRRDVAVRVHDDGALGVSRELRVERAQGLDDPVVVLEEAVGRARLGAGEVPREEEEVARRVVDAQLARWAARLGKGLRAVGQR